MIFKIKNGVISIRFYIYYVIIDKLNKLVLTFENKTEG